MTENNTTSATDRDEDLLIWPRVDCICVPPDGCQCGPEERVLRNYCTALVMPPMTKEHRDWCLQEIDRVEGYKAADYHDVTDADLARGVISAWTDYARDKGLI